MNRKILLIEPNYKNKYPPIGLMKISTYYKMLGDEVTFFKGDLKDFAAELVTNDLIEKLLISFPEIKWKHYYPILFTYVRKGKYKTLEDYDIFNDEIVLEFLKEYRKRYVHQDYFLKPRFDRVGITTLFTFYWDITIDTINFAKNLCKDPNEVMVGGIMSSILPDKVFEATGIKPFVGQLSEKGILDDNDIIIDTLPLDYSILDEIDYQYPADNAYFQYMSRGCVNKCKFCAVPILEPQFKDYFPLKANIKATDERFGPKGNLLLLDNNVLASKCFDQIIDEIVDCGFGKDAKYQSVSEYDVFIKNLRDGYNDRAYIKNMVSLYKNLVEKVKDISTKEMLLTLFEEKECMHVYTATKESIISIDEIVKPIYDKVYKYRGHKMRYVDFNQGIDSRLINETNMKKLAEININPLRIAFDHWELREIYEKSVRTATGAGIKKLSNYLLYNFTDKPEDLYFRLRMNVDLCEELDASIYSFPMKYHPISDDGFYMNRDYIGKHWNRKFIRAVQAVLNSTKGKIGRGKDFFEEAFGKDVEEFMKILWMPETFIIYRRVFDASLRSKLKGRYEKENAKDCDYANDWWRDFNSLSEKERDELKQIVATNNFQNINDLSNNPSILNVLRYYTITRDDVTQ